MSAIDKLYTLVKTQNINDDNEENCCGVSTGLIRKLTDLFFTAIGEKASTNIPLSKIHRLRKGAKMTRLYGTMYLELDDYPPYYDKKPVIFETHINRNLRCSHGYTNSVRHTDLSTWVSKNAWEILFYEFPHAERVGACPRTIICNKGAQNNMIGEILNATDNDYDQEDFGFTGSYLKIAPTVIDDSTKKKFLNMQLENLRPMISIDNNEKQTDGRNQKKMIDDK